MAKNRKLGRPTDQRLAMLRGLTTSVIVNGKIETTLARAKEVKAITDSLMALAVKEKDNFDMVEEKRIQAKREKDGKKATELVKSKNGKEYLRVVKEEVTVNVQKDRPSRLNARRKMIRMVNKVKDENGKNIDVPGKLFNELAPKYADRVGGYTRIIKLGKRRGDGAEVAILELV